MKDLTKTPDTAAPQPVTAADGPLAFAADHLRAIHYPNRLNDIAVVGTRGAWHRSFLLRPRFGGRYLFLMYPRDNLAPELVLERTFSAPSFNSAPEVLDISVPGPLRLFDTWDWRVIKTDGSSEREDDLEEWDALAVSDGLLTGRANARLARHAREEKRYATLVHRIRPAMHGRVTFDEEKPYRRARVAIWSCHQPYGSHNGRAVVKPATRKILAWYRQVMERFAPDRIWMLGDSVYSDGTSTLNFVGQVYDQRGWQENQAKRKDLLSLYRLNYRFHWSFDDMQAVMRRFPHLGMWDDHEIRDGYGSEEADFRASNVAIKQLAAQAAEEYLFQYSPKLRSESTRNSAVDNHQAYVSKTVAAFLFDGRNSRNYGENMPVPSEVPLLASTLAGFLAGALTGGVAGAALGAAAGAVSGAELTAEIVDLYRWHNPGEVISDLQLKDFERFCGYLKGRPGVKYLLMGNSVPFIYILDFVESFAAESALAGTDVGKNMRDDIRDSWHSPANRRQLSRLIDILRDLHRARPDLEIVNLSGDIHLSNAFRFQPPGFSKPLYQVTSSALTNDPPDVEGLLNLLSVDGPLSANASSDLFGRMERLWHEGSAQNFMTIEADTEALRMHLHVYDAERVGSGKKDRELALGVQGEQLKGSGR